MRYAYGLLLRFIDLGLLLLMTFLAVADMGNTFQVALPGAQTGLQPGNVTHRLSVEPGARYTLTTLTTDSPACIATSRETMVGCLVSAGVGDVVVRGEGAASVQDVVNVLDSCANANRYCALEVDLE